MREGQKYRLDYFLGMKAFDRYGGDLRHYESTATRGWRDGWHARAEAAKRGSEHRKQKAEQMGRRGIYRDAEACARRLGC